MPHISVVSPVYRGEKMVHELVTRVKENVSKLTDDFDVILVNDASPDLSWQMILKECAVKVIYRLIQQLHGFDRCARFVIRFIRYKRDGRTDSRIVKGILTVEPDGSFIRLIYTGNQAEQCGFARTVDSDKAEYRTVIHLQVQAVQYLMRTEGFLQLINLKHVMHPPDKLH